MMSNTHNKIINTTVEEIGYCFSQNVDNRSLNIAYRLLESMKLPEADINTIIFMLATTCAKHYQYGYNAACQNCKML